MINSISVGYGSMSGAPVVAVDDELNAEAVSYTHLTLPTIYSV